MFLERLHIYTSFQSRTVRVKGLSLWNQCVASFQLNRQQPHVTTFLWGLYALELLCSDVSKYNKTTTTKWHPTTNYNKRGNILITNFRSNIFISGVISPSGGAIFLWRQYSYQGRQYSYQLYNIRLQPYLENDVVAKRYAVEDFKSEILSTQAAWLSSRMRKYQGAWYLCQSKKLSRTLLGGEIFGF